MNEWAEKDDAEFPELSDAELAEYRLGSQLTEQIDDVILEIARVDSIPSVSQADDIQKKHRIKTLELERDYLKAQLSAHYSAPITAPVRSAATPEPLVAVCDDAGKSRASTATRATNKGPKTLAFEAAVMAEMTQVWNQYKTNKASNGELAEPTKGDMHDSVFNNLKDSIESKNKKPTLQMVADAAKPWKKPASIAVPVVAALEPVKRHKWKGAR
jgi:hypothetical protein